MASGKSIELQKFDLTQFYRVREPREKRQRDRSLRGKARIRARKAARRVLTTAGCAWV